jgi:hypothetical protein
LRCHPSKSDGVTLNLCSSGALEEYSDACGVDVPAEQEQMYNVVDLDSLALGFHSLHRCTTRSLDFSLLLESVRTMFLCICIQRQCPLYTALMFWPSTRTALLSPEVKVFLLSQTRIRLCQRFGIESLNLMLHDVRHICGALINFRQLWQRFIFTIFSLQLVLLHLIATHTCWIPRRVSL